MHDDSGFVNAIIAAPDDDLPRLIWADALDERGDPRGEFVRIQCELAGFRGGQGECLVCREPLTSPQAVRVACEDCRNRLNALRRRERALFNLHGRDWLRQDAPPDFVVLSRTELSRTDQTTCEPPYGWGTPDEPRAIVFCEYHRGGIDTIRLSWESARWHLPAIREAAPLSRVVLTDMPQQTNIPVAGAGRAMTMQIEDCRQQHGFVWAVHQAYADRPGEWTRRVFNDMLAAEFGAGLEWELSAANHDFDPATDRSWQARVTIGGETFEGRVEWPTGTSSFCDDMQPDFSSDCAPAVTNWNLTITDLSADDPTA